MKKIFPLGLLLISIFLIAGCSSSSDSPGNENGFVLDPSLDTGSNNVDFGDIAVIDLSDISDIDLMVSTKSTHEQLFIKANKNDINIPESIYYYNGERDTGLHIMLDENGSLDKYIIEDHVVIIRNIEGSLFDAGILFPNGELEIFRGLEAGIDLGVVSFSEISARSGWQESLLNFASLETIALPCVMAALNTAVAIADPTGLSLFNAASEAFSCGYGIGEMIGTYLNDQGFRIYVSQEFIDNWDDFFETFEVAKTTFSCYTGSPQECVISSTGLVADSLIDDENLLVRVSAEVSSILGALDFGFGDVQINLTWDNNADLDLHVIDPSGEEIFWNNPYSISGGILDVDDIDGFGPENIYWPDDEAPNGTYYVFVHHYIWNQPDRPDNSNYTVLINAFGTTEKYTGNLPVGEYVDILVFDENGLNKISYDPKTITIKNKN